MPLANPQTAPLPFIFRPPGRVDGRYSGRHRSVQRGRSQSFEDHRPYIAGDDVRDVDWKLYARSDRLYVKRYEMHTQLAVYFILDASASMAYAGRGITEKQKASSERLAALRQVRGLAAHKPEPGSKFEAAREAALGLARIVLAQQDRAGVALTDAGGLQTIAARGGMDHLITLQQTLERAVPSAKTATDQALATLAAQHRRAIAVVFTDLMHPRKQLLDALAAWRARGGEAMVCQVLHPDELSLPTGNGWSPAEAVDPETGRSTPFDPALVGKVFAKRSAEWVEGWRQALVSKGVDHRLLVSGRPWVDAMRRWLAPL